MTPEHWQRIKALLESALERKPGERSAFLAEACSGDESLRKEVESFIISHEQADSFIEEPAFEVMAESLEGKQEELVGHTLSHYKIHKQLGVGGMGEVYLAEDIRLGRKVAIKLLPDYFTKDDDRVLRFQQEARAASALNHPNILTIYEIGQTDSRHFIVTEFIEGQTLSQCLKAGMMKIPEALDIAIQIASALSAAHAAAIVHRDIKPDNVMVRADGIVKVLDFGLAKLTEQKGNELKAPNLVKTKQGVVMGSAHYMSPDQARGLQLDTRTDLFSLGAVLYEMVTGRMPFAGETMTDVLASILRVEPSALDQFRPEAPAEMQRIVAKALRKDKEERYQAAKELRSDLKTLKQRLEFERELQRSGEKLTASGEGKPAAGKVKSAGASKLRRKATLSPHPSRAAKSKAIDSLAVLPLINDSPDADMEYFSDGVTESIINALSQLPKLRVVARSTVFRYKGREVDPKEVGQQLGVRAVLTGRVRQTGDGLMIAAELIDVTNDSQLWGEHYSRALSDVFVVQEEIAKEISEKLRLKLTGEEKKRLAKRHTGSTEAYKLYLKGLYYWNKRTVECLKKGIEYFEQAIEMDPNYALAYAGLADSYVLLGRYEALSPKESFPKAKAAAMKALQIDPGLAEAFPSLASAKFKYDWDWAGAERDFKHGIELNPNCATARHWYGHYLWCLGRFDEAFKQTQQALQLDPLSLMIDVSSTTPYLYARQYDQVIKTCRRILDLHPNFPPAHTHLGWAYEQTGQLLEAIAEFQKACLLDDNPENLASLGHAYAKAGKIEEARGRIEKLEELSRKRYASAYGIALIHIGLEEKDQALRWLEKAYKERSYWLVHLKVDPRFDGLRSDPRFTDLVQRIGLSTAEHHTTKELPGGPTSASIPLEQEIRFCTTTDGVRIAYATVGQGAPLVKAANWLNHLEFDWRSPIWRHVLEEFARDHLLVRYDERGNGLSDWNVENFTFEAFVRDLESVVEAIGLDRFPILGISQGGPVAIAYAVRHPEKVSHLVLYGSYARGWARRGSAPEVIQQREAQHTLIKLGWGQDNPAFRQLWTTLYVPDATPEQWQWFNDLHRVSTSPENAVRLLNELGQIDVVNLLQQVKVPTLVLHCRDEVVVPFEEGRLLAGLIPGARFVPLEGRNHLLLEHEPAWPKFVTEVRRFLKTSDA